MRIGGHWGLDVIREHDDVLGTKIVKRARNGVNPDDGRFFDNKASIAREAKALKIMSGSGFAPELLEEHEDYIIETDLGDQGTMDEENLWRRSATRMLWEIRRHGLRHGDLTGANIICRDNRVWAVDWQEAHVLGEPGVADKQRATDSQLLFERYLAVFKSVHGKADESRIARRWNAIIGQLGAGQHDDDNPLPLKGKTFLDLGCFQGDFCGAAAAEGMEAVGVDLGGFRSDEDSIEIAQDVWRDMLCIFDKKNIMHWTTFSFDVVMMFSTWPYIVNDYGRERAEQLLREIVEQCGVLFFETQLAGDGPGPDFLQSDDDVALLLSQFGEVNLIVTLPTGRPTSRSIWEVRRESKRRYQMGEHPVQVPAINLTSTDPAVSGWHRETSFLQDHPSDKDSVILVIGAYTGTIAELLLAERPDARHYLFEPQDWAAKKLRERFAGKSNVKVCEFALGHRAGTFQMALFGGEYCSFMRGPQPLQKRHERYFEARMEEFGAFTKAEGIECAYHVSMNIESYEYILLPHLDEIGWLDRIDTLGISWHGGGGKDYTFQNEAASHHEEVVSKLEKQHELVLSIDNWQSWTKNPKVQENLEGDNTSDQIDLPAGCEYPGCGWMVPEGKDPVLSLKAHSRKHESKKDEEDNR